MSGVQGYSAQASGVQQTTVIPGVQPTSNPPGVQETADAHRRKMENSFATTSPAARSTK